MDPTFAAKRKIFQVSNYLNLFLGNPRSKVNQQISQFPIPFLSGHVVPF